MSRENYGAPKADYGLPRKPREAQIDPLAILLRKTKGCKNCGADISDRVGQTRFCTRECWSEYHLNKYYTSRGRSAEIVEQTCEFCKSTFMPKTRKKTRFCSIKCIFEARAAAYHGPLEQRFCAHCGAAFIPSTRKQVYCMNACAKKMAAIAYYAGVSASALRKMPAGERPEPLTTKEALVLENKRLNALLEAQDKHQRDLLETHQIEQKYEESLEKRAVPRDPDGLTEEERAKISALTPPEQFSVIPAPIPEQELPQAPQPLEPTLCLRCKVKPPMTAIDEYCEACDIINRHEIEASAMASSPWTKRQ